MTITLRNVTALQGPNLEATPNCRVKISGQYFVSIKGNAEESRGGVSDASGFVLIPGLINAHVHIGDAVAKEKALGLNLNDLVDPWRGLKQKILSSTPTDELVEAMRNAAEDMLRCGITTFADFREGGFEGIQLLRAAVGSLKITSVKLGRPDYYFDRSRVRDCNAKLPTKVYKRLHAILKICDGLGLSGPNEFTDRSLQQMHALVESTGKLSAIHAAESQSTVDFSKRTFGKTEVERALQNLHPHTLIHLTHASQADLDRMRQACCSVICCPRANAVLRVGFPPIREMLRRGLTVALGTDNVMVNAPNLFREMEYTSRVLHSIRGKPIHPREILKMVSINAARALRLDTRVGSIEVGKRADAVLLNGDSLNLRPINDVYASIVHRARPDDISAVIAGGEVVWGEVP